MSQTAETARSAEAPVQPQTMERLAIIVREGSYDRVLTPLAFAYLAAASEVHVDMLFVNWAVRAVMKEQSRSLPMSAEHADELEYVRERVAAAGLPPDVPDIISAIKATGNVNLYVCSLAASIFEANEDNVLPEVDGIVGATWFLTDRARTADITQCF
jgi:peroxiredoxin family protein